MVMDGLLTGETLKTDDLMLIMAMEENNPVPDETSTTTGNFLPGRTQASGDFTPDRMLAVGNLSQDGTKGIADDFLADEMKMKGDLTQILVKAKDDVEQDETSGTAVDFQTDETVVVTGDLLLGQVMMRDGLPLNETSRKVADYLAGEITGDVTPVENMGDSPTDETMVAAARATDILKPDLRTGPDDVTGDETNGATADSLTDEMMTVGDLMWILVMTMDVVTLDKTSRTGDDFLTDELTGVSGDLTRTFAAEADETVMGTTPGVVDVTMPDDFMMDLMRVMGDFPTDELTMGDLTRG